MQRVRIGLTGLASVFLAVLLAAVFTGRAQEETPGCPSSASPAPPGAAAQQASPKEPLAELGVVPNCDSNAMAIAADGAAPAGRR